MLYVFHQNFKNHKLKKENKPIVRVNFTCQLARLLHTSCLVQ